MPTLEERVIRLEDIEQIRKLKAAYCNACDDNHNAERIAALFTEDGIWENEDLGKFQGTDEIRSAFEGFAKSITFSQHNTTNLDIEVHGDVATGTWHFTGVVAPSNKPARLTLARYTERYVKISGEWKFAHLHAVRLAFHELPLLHR